MNKNLVTLAKIVLALHNQKVDVSDGDALAFLQYNPFDIYTDDNIIVSKEDVKELVKVISDPLSVFVGVKGHDDSGIMKGLDNTMYEVGDVVEAKYGSETITGKITGAFYTVEGTGKKYHNFEDLIKVK